MRIYLRKLLFCQLPTRRAKDLDEGIARSADDTPVQLNNIAGGRPAVWADAPLHGAATLRFEQRHGVRWKPRPFEQRLAAEAEPS